MKEQTKDEEKRGNVKKEKQVKKDKTKHDN